MSWICPYVIFFLCFISTHFCQWCRFLHFYTLYFYKSLRKCLWHCYRFSPPWSFSPRWLHTPQTHAWSLSVGGSTCRSSLWPTLRSAYCRCLDDCNYYLKSIIWEQYKTHIPKFFLYLFLQVYIHDIVYRYIFFWWIKQSNNALKRIIQQQTRVS